MASIILDDSTSHLSLGGGEWKRVEVGRYFDGSTIYPWFSADPAKGDTGTYGSLSITFQGTSISFHGNTPSPSNSQNIFVSIDGGQPYETTYSDPTPPTNTQWYQSPMLEDGTHTIAITHIAGTAIDYLVITAGPNTPLSSQQLIVDDDDGEITYSGSWTRDTGRFSATGSPVGFLPYGNATHRTNTPGSSATFQFTGTTVEVYSVFDWSRLGDLGLTFTVDSTSIQKTYSVTPDTSEFRLGVSMRENVLLFSSASLAPGDHTLKVEVTSSTNQSALVLDYIVYTPSFDTLAAKLSGQTGSATNSPSPPVTSGSSKSQSAPMTATSVHAGFSQIISGSPTTLTGAATSVLVMSPDGGGSNTAASEAKKSTPLGAIVGGVIGGLALLVLVILLLFRKRIFKAAPASPAPLVQPTPGRAALLMVNPFPNADPSPSFYEPTSAISVSPMTATTADDISSSRSDDERGFRKPRLQMSQHTPVSYFPVLESATTLSYSQERNYTQDSPPMDSGEATFRSRMQRLEDLVVELNRRIAEGGEADMQVAELRERILNLTQQDMESREGERTQDSEIMTVPPPYEPRQS